MINLFLILDVFDEVPQFKSAVLPEAEAADYVREYCEENNLTYKGLDYFLYYPEYHRETQAFLQVAPVDPVEGVQLGFYWENKPKLKTVYPNKDD